MHALAILGVLTDHSSAINPTSRHTGRGHRHPQLRQGSGGNGSAAGLTEIIPPPPVLSGPISSSTAALHDTILPASATAITLPSVSSYTFPSTVTQVAFATICLDTPSSSAIFSILPTDSASSLTTSTATSHRSIETSVLPVLVNATMVLSNGSSVTFLSLSTTTTTVTSDPSGALIQPTEQPSVEIARIVLDANGCQTVYTETTAPACATTLRLPGMLPAPITDCDQSVTFSSQSLGDCSDTLWIASQAYQFSTLETPASTVSSSPASTQITGPMAYYVAHWYELIQGPVPEVVKIENCIPQSASGHLCQTSSEQWSVVYDTEVVTTSSLTSFREFNPNPADQHPVKPAALTSSTKTLSTYLDFLTAITVYQTITRSSICRMRIATENFSSTPQRTVTVVVSTPTIRTLLLEEVAKETDTTVTERITIVETSTVQITETRTKNIGSASPGLGIGDDLDK
ncbi:hypothetical protein LTR84_007146 [Exophiala bonariae]|uniref:Ig-like domain-containing protein n=1 Tax=Exophiala bonariae TaxID=1690606 RepID=A0AAV9MYS9_9EURO|nr:hypothetical protein LTR84_007146 [Exophiala bonariae]